MTFRDKQESVWHMSLMITTFPLVMARTPGIIDWRDIVSHRNLTCE